MDILGLNASGPAVLSGSGASGSVKVGIEVPGKWRSPWDDRLLREAWLGPDGKESREIGLGGETYLYDSGVGKWRCPRIVASSGLLGFSKSREDE